MVTRGMVWTPIQRFPKHNTEPFAKLGGGHENGAESHGKIMPSIGICTWLAVVFPRERGRPARILVKALLQGQSTGEPTNSVRPIATTLPGLVRAGRPRSRGGILHTLNRKHGLHHARESVKASGGTDGWSPSTYAETAEPSGTEGLHRRPSLRN